MTPFYRQFEIIQTTESNLEFFTILHGFIVKRTDWAGQSIQKYFPNDNQLTGNRSLKHILSFMNKTNRLSRVFFSKLTIITELFGVELFGIELDMIQNDSFLVYKFWIQNWLDDSAFSSGAF